jgi:hypothetical protein
MAVFVFHSMSSQKGSWGRGGGKEEGEFVGVTYECVVLLHKD